MCNSSSVRSFYYCYFSSSSFSSFCSLNFLLLISSASAFHLNWQTKKKQGNWVQYWCIHILIFITILSFRLACWATIIIITYMLSLFEEHAHICFGRCNNHKRTNEYFWIMTTILLWILYLHNDISCLTKFQQNRYRVITVAITREKEREVEKKSDWESNINRQGFRGSHIGLAIYAFSIHSSVIWIYVNFICMYTVRK